MKSLIHSQTSKVQPLKFGNGLVISFHTVLDILHIPARIKDNPCYFKCTPGDAGHVEQRPQIGLLIEMELQTQVLQSPTKNRIEAIDPTRCSQ